MIQNTHSELRCRLCDGALLYKFKLRLLEKYDATYFECEQCHSLQTEPPYWLDEAYGNKNLSNLDTGAVQRNIHNLAASYAISKLFKVKNVLDIGGGDGLLCRMLRDYDINCYVKDKYATPTYAQGFTDQDFDVPDLIVAFEILEHFPNPKSDLEEIFKYNANVLLLSTSVYGSEKEDWWYLAPESGQHVFFYSIYALKKIAEKYSYSLIFSGGFILLLRNASKLKKTIAKVLLKFRVCRLLRAIVILLPARGVWKDHSLQVNKSKQARPWL